MEEGSADGPVCGLRDVETFESNAQAFARDGQMTQASDLYEHALLLRIQLFGHADVSVLHGIRCLVETRNKSTRIEMCSGGDFAACVSRLKALLHLLGEVGAHAYKEELAPCMHLTLNTLASFHRRLGDTVDALSCFHEAIALWRSLSKVDVATTHLGLCSLYSELGQHEEAELHAFAAVEFCEAAILHISTSHSEADLSEKAMTLAVAYNNLAVQREYLGKGKEALDLYEKSVVLAQSFETPGDFLVRRLKESHRQAFEKANALTVKLPSPEPEQPQIKVAHYGGWNTQRRNSIRDSKRRAISQASSRPQEPADFATTSISASERLASLLRSPSATCCKLSKSGACVPKNSNDNDTPRPCSNEDKSSASETLRLPIEVLESSPFSRDELDKTETDTRSPSPNIPTLEALEANKPATKAGSVIGDESPVDVAVDTDNSSASSITPKIRMLGDALESSRNKQSGPQRALFEARREAAACSIQRIYKRRLNARRKSSVIVVDVGAAERNTSESESHSVQVTTEREHVVEEELVADDPDNGAPEPEAECPPEPVQLAAVRSIESMRDLVDVTDQTDRCLLASFGSPSLVLPALSKSPSSRHAVHAPMQIAGAFHPVSSDRFGHTKSSRSCNRFGEPSERPKLGTRVATSAPDLSLPALSRTKSASSTRPAPSMTTPPGASVTLQSTLSQDICSQASNLEIPPRHTSDRAAPPTSTALCRDMCDSDQTQAAAATKVQAWTRQWQARHQDARAGPATKVEAWTHRRQARHEDSLPGLVPSLDSILRREACFHLRHSLYVKASLKKAKPPQNLSRAALKHVCFLIRHAAYSSFISHTHDAPGEKEPLQGEVTQPIHPVPLHECGFESPGAEPKPGKSSPSNFLERKPLQSASTSTSMPRASPVSSKTLLAISVSDEDEAMLAQGRPLASPDMKVKMNETLEKPLVHRVPYKTAHVETIEMETLPSPESILEPLSPGAHSEVSSASVQRESKLGSLESMATKARVSQTGGGKKLPPLERLSEEPPQPLNAQRKPQPERLSEEPIQPGKAQRKLPPESLSEERPQLEKAQASSPYASGNAMMAISRLRSARAALWQATLASSDSESPSPAQKKSKGESVAR